MMRFKSSFLCYLIILILSFTENVKSQDNTPNFSLKPTPLILHDLSAFEANRSAQWKIAGNVFGDRTKAKDLEIKTGKGILVYLPKAKGNKTLKTELIHGDIDLNLDFLLSKSATFSILFQERYEITITDEWLKNGNNAIKAPGLWQHVSIRFKAPEFDANGKKTSNARLEEVILNGQQVKTPSEITLSENSTFKDEKALGAILIRGANTSFAIRNMSYKIYKEEIIKLSNIKFKVYNGLHKTVDTLQSLKPKRTGVTDTISHRVGDRKSQLVFEGLTEIPTDGEYLFKLTAGGGAWLFIDNQLMIDNRGSRDFEKAFYAKQSLKKGKYPFKIVYSNSDECLVLHYEGPQIPWQSLTTVASVRNGEQFEPLEYKLNKKPALQRGFMLQNGAVNPYIAAVGIPGIDSSTGFNYAFDMKKYNLTAAWHGKFIDVSNMWTERGEKQLEIPLGAKLELSGKPFLSGSSYEKTSWPDSVQAPEGVYQNRGYRLNEDGSPVFYYAINDTSIEDFCYPNESKTGLTRALKISNPSATTYGLLAEGKVIEKLGDGGYAVDDKNYYLTNLNVSNLEIKIIHNTEGDKLVATVRPGKEPVTIKYDIIW